MHSSRLAETLLAPPPHPGSECQQVYVVRFDCVCWRGGKLFYFLVAFFFPATVLRLPLRVRLLVRVR